MTVFRWASLLSFTAALVLEFALLPVSEVARFCSLLLTSWVCAIVSSELRSSKWGIALSLVAVGGAVLMLIAWEAWYESTCRF